MKKIIFFIPVLFFSFLTANGQSGKKLDKSQSDNPVAFSRLQFLQEAFNSTDPDEGKVVDRKLAETCIARFTAEMLHHGFDTTDVPSGISETVIKRIMTKSISFRGWMLGEWMEGILSSAASRKDVEFRIELGIYDQPFIKEYVLNDATQQRPRLNRITAFIVPYKTGTNTILTTIPPDEAVYNLGGLKP